MKGIILVIFLLGMSPSDGFTSPPSQKQLHRANQMLQLRHVGDSLSIGSSMGGLSLSRDGAAVPGCNWNFRKLKSKNKAAISSVALSLIAITFNSAVANAAKKKVADTAVAATITLPATSSLVLACVLPTLLGFYKSEYGVSYGYGTAMVASSYLVLSSIASASGSSLLPSRVTPSSIIPAVQSFLCTLKSLTSSLPAFHAASLLFYGTRLNLFLLYRELCLPRFRAMRERIEERAKKQGSRIKRTPFIASCAFLYYCMMCPLLVTSKLCEGLSMGRFAAGGPVTLLEQILRALIGLTLAGFMLGAIGDLNKSIGKMAKGEDALITGGVFRFFRHPNYTGEVIGWVSNCLAAFAAVAWKGAKGEGLAVWKNQTPYLLLSVLGAMGITFVLGTATAGLEFRQHEKYGDTEEYKTWVKKSWVGFNMGQRQESNDSSEDNSDQDEKSGN